MPPHYLFGGAGPAPSFSDQENLLVIGCYRVSQLVISMSKHLQHHASETSKEETPEAANHDAEPDGSHPAHLRHCGQEQADGNSTPNRDTDSNTDGNPSSQLT